MLRNIRIGLRLTLAFSSLVLVMVVLGLYALTQVNAINNEINVISQYRVPALVAVSEMNAEFLRIRVQTGNVISADNPQARARFEGRLQDARDKLQAATNTADGLIRAPEARALFDRYRNLQQRYFTEQQAVLRLAGEGRLAEAANARESRVDPITAELMGTLRELLDFQDQRVKDAAELTDRMYEAARLGVLVAVLLAVLITGLLSWRITRSLVLPVREAASLTKVIASGDLTSTIRVSGKDEISGLLGSLNAMQADLRDTIATIAHSSDQLASTSEELSAVTEESNRGLQQQSDELDQAATAVTEMTTAVEDVARNAASASESSQDANARAEGGQEQVDETIAAMEDLAANIVRTVENIEALAAKAADIGGVLDVIRGIAEQTNLLALNAAIEAARAGEMGRGFAVVADEVRALAHRTQESTKEIEGMIGAVQDGTKKAVGAMQSSNQRSQDALKISREAGAALRAIAQAVSDINERNLTIASAAEEQAQVARDVDRNLVNIRDLATQTAAGANQTSASSEELARLATELANMVRKFRV